jgi:hypothetical protein
MNTHKQKKQGRCMFGTAHWYGTINDCAAVATSWYGGAGMWIFKNKKWGIYKKQFDGLESLYKYFDIEV